MMTAIGPRWHTFSNSQSISSATGTTATAVMAIATAPFAFTRRRQRWRRLSVRACAVLFVIAASLLADTCSAHGHGHHHSNDSHTEATPPDHVHSEGCGCPKHRALLAAQKELIPDPTDTHPPDIHEGIARFIPDPSAIRPDYWDEEDDGPWEADLIENPEYQWSPRLIRNPAYRPPPTYAEKLGDEIQEALPWVTLGVLLVAALSIVPLPLDVLRSQLSGDGPFAAFKAAFIGLATPLCSCGSLPIASGLIEAGIPLSSVVAFLTASQSAGLDSAIITYGLLGPVAAICRLLGALILAIVAGTVLKSNKKTGTLSKDRDAPSKSNGNENGSPTSVIGTLTKFLSELVDTATEIMPLVVVGLVISTAGSHFVPMLTAPFDAMKGDDENTSIIAGFILRIGVLASALPLQLCEHTTAALAAGIEKTGGSSGLAFAFLLSAPATNLPSLMLLTRTSGAYGRFTALKVAAALSGTALALSYAIDVAAIDLLVVKEAESDTGAMAALPSQFITASPWIAGTLMLAGIAKRLKQKFASKKETDDCCSSGSCGSKKESSAKKND